MLSKSLVCALVLLLAAVHAAVPSLVVSFPPPTNVANSVQQLIPSGPPVIGQTIPQAYVYVPYYDYYQSNLRTAVAAYNATPGADVTQPAAELVVSMGSWFKQQIVTVGVDAFVSGETIPDVLSSGSLAAQLDPVAQTVVWAIDRKNNTAPVIWVEEYNLAIMFIGNASESQTGYIELRAVHYGSGTTAWSRTVDATVALNSLVYYQDYLYYFVGTYLYQRAVQTGVFTNSAGNLCGITPAPGAALSLVTPTYAYDANGALDAFVVYANTTRGSTYNFTICRFSHNSFGAVKWVFSTPEDLILSNVVGGGGNLFFTGRDTTNFTPNYFTIAFNADTGLQVRFPYVRKNGDARSYPVALPVNIPPCVNATMVQQFNGNTVAYCGENPSRAAWSAVSQPCYHTAVFVAGISPSFKGSIACSHYAKSVDLLDAATGMQIWSQPFAVNQQPATDGINVFAIDVHAQLSMFGVAPPTGNGGNGGGGGGLNGGSTAAVVICVLLVVIVAAFVGYKFAGKRQKVGMAEANAMNENGTINQQGYDGIS